MEVLCDPVHELLKKGTVVLVFMVVVEVLKASILSQHCCRNAIHSSIDMYLVRVT